MTCRAVAATGFHNWDESDGQCWNCDVVAYHLVDELTMQALSPMQMNNAAVLAVTQ